MTPIVRISDGKKPDRTLHLNKKTISIGRESANEIHLLDSEVSRKHAEIRYEDASGYLLIDLESSNGTLVNGIKISRCKLNLGDQITIGSANLTFQQITPSSYTNTSVDVILNQENEDGSRIISDYSHLPIRPKEDEHPPLISDKELSLDRSNGETDRSLEVIYQTALAIGRPEELKDVLERILQLVFDWVDADRGCIMLRDDADLELYPAARRDRMVEGDRQPREFISISSAIADHVLNHRCGVRTSNAKEDQRFDQSFSIITRGIREALCVPLQGRYSIVGLLYVDTYTPPGGNKTDQPRARFTDEHLKLMTAIGYQAAIAIEDTHYYSTQLKAERLTAMGKALTSLSHDIKNIVQGIRGGSYLIDHGLKQENSEVIRRGWKMVERNQERIANLVLDMLTFSKDRKPRFKRQDLNPLIEEVLEEFQTRSSDRFIEYKLNLCDNPAICDFDSESLHRALLNLLINATEAVTERQRKQAALVEQQIPTQKETDIESYATLDKDQVEPGHITVTTEKRPDGSCRIRIEDNGSGIPYEIRDKVFEFFESTKGASGTGIGLPVSAKIVEEHHGTIQILEPKHGTGTTVQITLPDCQASEDLESSDPGISPIETLH